MAKGNTPEEAARARPARLNFRKWIFRDLNLAALWRELCKTPGVSAACVSLVSFAIWLGFFTLLLELYVTSYGSKSFVEYVMAAPLADVIRTIWELTGRRDTAGLVVIASTLTAPLMFGAVVLWMLKSGRALSRHILYLLNVRSTRRLASLVIMGELLAIAAATIYFAVFYLLATEFEKRTDLARLFSERPLAMATAPFGSVDPSGEVIEASSKIKRAGVLALLAAIAGIGFPIGVAIQRRSRMIYGDARLGTLTDAADFGLRQKRGVVLGTKQGLLFVDDSDKHVLVIGSPGQGKSRSLVIPSIMRFGGSMVVLDFGGELYKDMAGWLAADGYRVHVIAPGKNQTDGFNPFDFISSDPIQRITDLQKLSLMIMPERARSEASDFWEESARILLTALMAFVIECPDTRKTLGELQRILGSMPDEREAIARLMEEYEHVLSDATRMQLNKFCGRHEKLGEGIAAEIGARIDVLQNKNLDAMLSATTIPLADIRTRKMAIFLDVDIQSVRIFERFISLLVETLMDIFIKQGPLRDNQHDVMVMLDEFGNAGRLDTILTQAPLMRKYGIRFVSILQDSAQLERLYDKTGREIIAGSSTIKLYMNFQNPRDAQYVSTIAGKTTQWLPTSSYTYRHGRRDRQVSMMPVQKDLLSVADLMMLKPEESILHVAGAPVFKLLKVEGSDDLRFADYTKFKAPPHPRMEIIETCGIDMKPQFGRDGSRIYVSTLDGLRQRLGLDPTPEGENTNRQIPEGDQPEVPRAIANGDRTEAVGLADQNQCQTTDGQLDDTKRAAVDPGALNWEIMAMVKEMKAKVTPDTIEAMEMFESAISDPLGEDKGQKR